MLEKGGNSQHESLVNIKSPIYRLLFTKCSYPSNPNILLTTLGLYPLTAAPLKSARRETKKEMAGRYQSKGGTILPTLISRPWLRNTNSRTSTTPWRDSNGAVHQNIFTCNVYLMCGFLTRVSNMGTWAGWWPEFDISFFVQIPVVFPLLFCIARAPSLLPMKK